MAKNLVVHFSINGLTAKLADTVHRVVGGDRFEIVPAEPYTAADLEWNDPESRTSKEGRDKSILPAIRDRVEKMEDYDTLYVGFPIWWYTAPNIIFSFLASYDLRGKTIVPFATSGGSQIGSAARDMAVFAKGAEVKEGRWFSAMTSAPEIREWLDAMELGK